MKPKHLIFPLVLLSLLSVSCNKDIEPPPQDSSDVPTFHDHDWNWKKHPSTGLTIDTAWIPDTFFLEF